MRKMLVVAVREYLAAVRTKAFVVSLVIMPIMMGGSLFMQWVMRDFHDVKPKKFAVIDRTPGNRLIGPLEQNIEAYNKATLDTATQKRILPPFEVEIVPPSEDTPDAIAEQRITLSQRVRDGQLFGFLDIGPDVLQPMEDGDANERHAIRYQSNSPTNQSLPHLLKEPLNRAIENYRFSQSPFQSQHEQLRNIMRPTPLESTGLTRRNPITGAIEDGTLQSRIAPIAVPIGLMMLMFMAVMMSATPLMQSVVEEKMQRIAEVLLGSVRPFDLMLGKLLGMTGVSLTITAVYLGGVYWAARYYGFAEYIPIYVLVWFLVFQTLATLMYGSLFIAIGAACTEMKETQNLMWPVMLLVMLPMFLMGSILQEPNSGVATGLSFFPFSTPMMMIMRQSVPPGAPSWQPFVGVLLVLMTTLACVWAAGRIFRVGILMQGKAAKMGELIRWVMHG